MPRREEKGWWERYWTWVVGCGCLAPLLLVGGCIGVIWFGTADLVRSSDVYQEAMERVRAHPEVVAEMGQVEANWSGFRGNISLRSNGGDIDAHVALRGSRASGTLHIVAKKRGGEWETQQLEVTIDGRDRPIDVLAEPAAVPSGTES